MKKMKKIVAFLLATVMVLGMSMTALAANNSPAANANTQTGVIEITNANIGETYTGYKIFDVTYSGTNFAYTINEENTVIFNLVKNYTYNNKTVFQLEEQDETGIHTVAVNSEVEFDTESAAKDFASYLSKNLKVIPVPTYEVEGETYKVLAAADFSGTNNETYVNLTQNGDYVVENVITEEVYGNQTILYWNNLSLGYWFVTTSVGTLCVLDTTDSEVRISDKNPDTTIDKKVQEDSTGTWSETNTAEVGDVVEYTTLVKAQKGALNYKLYDKMTDGLTFNKDIVIYIDSNKDGLDYTDVNKNGRFDEADTVTESVLDDAKYTVEYDVTKTEKDTSYVCDFVVTFSQDYLDTITSEEHLIVSYSATLNDRATIAEQVNDANANLNDTKLEWGNDSSTEWDTTKTYVLYFDLVKTDSSNNYLLGAKFELYYDEACTQKVQLRSTGSHMYKVASAAWQNADANKVEVQKVGENGELVYDEEGNPVMESKFVSAVIEAAHAEISGLDANTTYYLKEVVAPDGYNVIDGVIPVTIGVNSLSTTFDPAASLVYKAYVDEENPGDGGVQVINKTGTELPSTGGMGTTVLYVVGGVLVVGAAIVLITRKRMNREA